MQALNVASHNVRLSTHVKGKPRKAPIWEMRYRLANGKDSTRTIAKAWQKQSRPPESFMTRSQAEAEAQRWMDQHADVLPESRKTFRRACEEFLRRCEREKGTRGTTLHEYRRLAHKLCERPWRGGLTWGDRPLDTFDAQELQAVREELIDRGLSSQTINQHRRVMRGALGEDHPLAKAWKWMAVKSHESVGKIHFYDPAQVARLKECAEDEQERAIYTLATEAGPRISEILALKVGNVDFESGLIRIEDGYTVRGGHAGTKSNRVRSVPMSANVHAALLPYCQGRLRHELVFTHDDRPGEPMIYDRIYRRFKRTAQRADLPAIRFHELRHSFGTNNIRDVDVRVLQELMGHEDIKTTMRYMHYRPQPDLAALLSKGWKPDLAPEDPSVVPIRKAS